MRNGDGFRCVYGNVLPGRNSAAFPLSVLWGGDAASDLSPEDQASCLEHCEPGIAETGLQGGLRSPRFESRLPSLDDVLAEILGQRPALIATLEADTVTAIFSDASEERRREVFLPGGTTGHSG